MIVEPAWAVADIATSGNKSEIVRRCFVNMVRLHHCWKRVMCALLIMSSEQIVWRLHHSEVKPRDGSRYQRNSRGSNAAPAKVQSTIAPPVSQISRHLIVKGMMRSLAKVHCELFVPPPNGVVLFKDAS